MNGRLRIDVTECERALSFEHARGRHLTGRDFAEQAIGHGPILTCGMLSGLPTDMVAGLLTSSAPRARPAPAQPTPRCEHADTRATRTLLPEQQLTWRARGLSKPRIPESLFAAVRLGPFRRMLERGIREARQCARVPRYIL